MMSTDWQCARSDFNHGWLKNRLLVALLKCKRIVSGQVEDGDAGKALVGLVAEWASMRRKAQSVLEHMHFRVTAPMEPTAIDVAHCGRDLASFLIEVERQMWMKHANPSEHAADALREIEALDRTLVSLALCLERPLGTLADRLDESIHITRVVAQRFAHLTVPRDVIIG